MGTMASQITSLTIVYATTYSGTNQRKHQSSASLAFVQDIHRWLVSYLRKWPIMWKMFPFDDVRCHALQLTLDHQLNMNMFDWNIWVRSRNCGCLVTRFCYQLIAKLGNETAAVSWPDPYTFPKAEISIKEKLTNGFINPTPDIIMTKGIMAYWAMVQYVSLNITKDMN